MKVEVKFEKPMPAMMVAFMFGFLGRKLTMISESKEKLVTGIIGEKKELEKAFKFLYKECPWLFVEGKNEEKLAEKRKA